MHAFTLMGRRWRLLPIALTLSVSTLAEAAPPEQCFSAYDGAQRLRRDVKLREAETELVRCAQTDCPVELQRDCVRWLDEVRTSMPSVVVRAVDEAGCDLVDARLSVDGKLVVDRLDGKALTLDPGVHTIQVERGTSEQPTAIPVVERIVLVVGEKNRLVTASFSANGATCGAARSVVRDAEKPAPRRTPLLTYALGAVGIVSLGFSTGFYASGFSQKTTLDDTCYPYCGDTGEVDAMRRSFIAGDVLLGLALASLTVAGIVYFTR